MGRPRKYSLNENYFKVINSENKAYVLGFIYADGSVYKNYLSIRLASKDIEILEIIKKELGYSGVILKNIINGREYVGLTISSKIIVDDLIKLGVIKKKTYLSKNLPFYNKKYEMSFLRGFFDGDGSIYSSDKRGFSEYTICFSGNKSILNQVKNILINYEISSSKIRHRHNNDESCMLEIRGNVNIEKLYGVLYKNGNLYLRRKKERFYNFIEMLNSLTKRNLSNNIVEDIKVLYMSGKKQVEISEIKNLPNSSVRTVIQRLRKHGEVK